MKIHTTSLIVALVMGLLLGFAVGFVGKGLIDNSAQDAPVQLADPVQGYFTCRDTGKVVGIYVNASKGKSNTATPERQSDGRYHFAYPVYEGEQVRFNVGCDTDPVTGNWNPTMYSKWLPLPPPGKVFDLECYRTPEGENVCKERAAA